MDDGKINVSDVLLAVSLITDKGTLQDGVYRYRGLAVQADVDGYTVVVKDDESSLTVMFHNTYKVDTTSRRAWSSFSQKLDAVIAEARD